MHTIWQSRREGRPRDNRRPYYMESLIFVKAFFGKSENWWGQTARDGLGRGEWIEQRVTGRMVRPTTTASGKSRQNLDTLRASEYNRRIVTDMMTWRDYERGRRPAGDE